MTGFYDIAINICIKFYLEFNLTLEAMNEKSVMKIIIPGKQAEGKKENIAPG